MQGQKIKVMVIGKTVEFKEIIDDLDNLYKETGCDCIDIVNYPINGKYYDIVCDDEGLFKTDPVVTAVKADGSPALVGGLIVCNYDDEEGELLGLEPDDILRLTNAIQYSIQYEHVQPVIVTDL